MGGNTPLQCGKHLAKTTADSAVCAAEGALGRHQGQIQIGQSLLIDALAVEQDFTQGQGLLGIVGVQPTQPPAMRFALPRLDTVDVVSDAAVMRFDLLRT